MRPADDGAPFIIWGFAECAVTIMAASIPAMRALFSEMRNNPLVRVIPSLVISPLPKPDESNNSTIHDNNNNKSRASPSNVSPAVPDKDRHDDRSDKSILGRAGLAASSHSSEGTPATPGAVYVRRGPDGSESYGLQEV